MSDHTRLVHKIEHSDKWFRITLLSTCIILVLLSVMTLIKVLQVNSQLQAQVEEARKNTDATVQRVEQENNREHAEQDRFLKCVFLIAIDQRTEAVLDNCMNKARQSGGNSASPQTNNTAPSPQSSVNYATPAPQSQKTDQVQPTTTSTPPEPQLLNRLPVIVPSPLSQIHPPVINVTN